MNFIFICIDTLRYDHLSRHGNDWISTPNFEAFAKEAMVFDNSYGGSFPTIPHRTDTITGRFGRPLHPWQPLAFDAVTLPRILGEAGWATQMHTEGDQAKYIKGRPGEPEQKRFYDEFIAWTTSQRVVNFFFEAFDENWKGGPHPNEVEKHWGLFRADRTPKLALQHEP